MKWKKGSKVMSNGSHVTDHRSHITAQRARESPARGIVEGLSDFGVEV